MRPKAWRELLSCNLGTIDPPGLEKLRNRRLCGLDIVPTRRKKKKSQDPKQKFPSLCSLCHSSLLTLYIFYTRGKAGEGQGHARSSTRLGALTVHGSLRASLTKGSGQYEYLLRIKTGFPPPERREFV